MARGDVPPPPQVNMAYEDQRELERTNAKNSVEEYVYSMRDKVEYAMSDFVEAGEKEAILKLLNATEEWLYDEGEDQPKKVWVGVVGGGGGGVWRGCDPISLLDGCCLVGRGWQEKEGG